MMKNKKSCIKRMLMALVVVTSLLVASCSMEPAEVGYVQEYIVPTKIESDEQGMQWRVELFYDNVAQEPRLTKFSEYDATNNLDYSCQLVYEADQRTIKEVIKKTIETKQEQREVFEYGTDPKEGDYVRGFTNGVLTSEFYLQIDGKVRQYRIIDTHVVPQYCKYETGNLVQTGNIVQTNHILFANTVRYDYDQSKGKGIFSNVIVPPWFYFRYLPFAVKHLNDNCIQIAEEYRNTLHVSYELSAQNFPKNMTISDKSVSQSSVVRNCNISYYIMN